MNLGENFSSLPIAKIPSHKIFPASLLEAKTRYEWFYFEAFTTRQPESIAGKEHFECAPSEHRIVLILSLKDPFFTENASAYFTWHGDNKVLEYCYNLFTHQAAADFAESVWNFLLGKTNSLALVLQSHCSENLVEVTLNKGSATGQLNFPGCSEENEFTSSFSSTNHFWQPLLHGSKTNFAISVKKLHGAELALGKQNAFDAAKPLLGSQRASKFFDVPLQSALRKRKQHHSISFISNDNNLQTHFYFDHNFGFEPLCEMKEHWYWWHYTGNQKKTNETKSDNTHMHSEIGYYFPNLQAGYLCTAENSLSHSKHFTYNPVVEQGLSLFGVPTVSKLMLSNANFVTYEAKIESAPFYTRLGNKLANKLTKKLIKKSVNPATPTNPTKQRGQPLSEDNFSRNFAGEVTTLETLFPARLRWWGCTALMQARVTKVTELPAVGPSFMFVELCKNVTKKFGKSFYFASKILSRTQQQRAYFVYLLCRLIDDATDEGIGEGSADSLKFVRSLFSEHPKPEDNISYLLSAVFALTGKRIQENDGLKLQYEMANTAKALQLQEIFFADLVEGQRCDENFSQPENFQAFYKYCYQVAGVVGLMMAKVLGARENAVALQAAEHLGIAMQITNIMRDIKEDHDRLQRTYLPADFCTEHGINLNALLQGVQRAPRQQNSQERQAPSTHSTPLGPTLSLLEARMRAGQTIVNHFGVKAIEYYTSALQGVSQIPSRRGRLCVKLMAAIYGRILGEIRATPHLPFTQRVVVSNPRKVLIFMQVLLGVSPLRAAKLSNGGQT